jgi:2-methylcitrate dehydratase PrpD
MTNEAKQCHMNMAQRIIDFLAQTGFNDLPSRTVEYCKLLVMDTMGVALPGAQAPGCAQVTEQLGQWASASGARLLLNGRTVAPPLAALGNSTIMHALDFDDTLDASALHCMVSVLPAALAVAEAEGGVDGKRFINALVLGVEVICRLSRAITTPLSWIRTATCGSFGAAAAAAKVLGLNRDQLTNALGVVYAQTSGNAQGLVEGRLVKRMQPGFASQAGVASAYLARSGITGSRDFLEGDYGFYNLYEKGQYAPAAALEGLGGEFLINQLSIKPYPCCRMTHSSIDAALELRPRLQDPAREVESIEVSVSSMCRNMVGKPFAIGDNPQVDAQFSIPYTVSMALLRGDVFLPDFEEKAIRDPQALALASKVAVNADPGLPDNDLMQARMMLSTQDGGRLQSEIKAPLGNPAKPMNLEACQEKFHKCLRYSGFSMGPARTAGFLALVEELEECPDVAQMPALLRGEA